MATFKEVSDSLSTALQDLNNKKVALDEANTAANKAQNDYNDAMNKAQSLRQQLTDSLEDVMPPMPDNVRVGTPR